MQHEIFPRKNLTQKEFSNFNDILFLLNVFRSYKDLLPGLVTFEPQGQKYVAKVATFNPEIPVD